MKNTGENQAASFGRKSFEEAAIHEHFHLWWMIYGFQTAFVYLLMSVVDQNSWTKYLAIFCWLMVQEYLAFGSTKRYATNLGLKARDFDKKTIAKYVMFYGSTVSSFGLVKMYIEPHVNVFVYMLILIAVLISLLKIWYVIWEKMGLIKGDVV